MLNCFEVFLPLVRGNLHLIEQLSYDFCKRQWEQNVVYCEVRYSPHLLAEAFTSDFSTGNDNVTTNDFPEPLDITPEAVFAAVTRVCILHWLIAFLVENYLTSIITTCLNVTFRVCVGVVKNIRM